MGVHRLDGTALRTPRRESEELAAFVPADVECRADRRR
jgi:hypothetical protein